MRNKSVLHEFSSFLTPVFPLKAPVIPTNWTVRYLARLLFFLYAQLHMDSHDYNAIYRSKAEQYERLVAREDYEGHILRALLEICNLGGGSGLSGRTIVDSGAGTGRLTKLLAPHASFIYGFDSSPVMLAVAAKELQKNAPRKNWGLAAADHRALPLPAESADLIISGWSLCYLALDQPQPWREPLRDVIGRFFEILRPGGTLIILETQGTGFTTPHPPQDLLEYFAFLQEVGFQTRWIRTDYEFSSLHEAEELTRFFFGDDLAERVKKAGSTRLPECTGIWWKKR